MTHYAAPVIIGPGVEFSSVGPFAIDLDSHELTITLIADWTPVAAPADLILNLSGNIWASAPDFYRISGDLLAFSEHTFPMSTGMHFAWLTGSTYSAGLTATYYVAAVPEPATIAMGGAGLLALIAVRRRGLKSS